MAVQAAFEWLGGAVGGCLGAWQGQQVEAQELWVERWEGLIVPEQVCLPSKITHPELALQDHPP